MWIIIIVTHMACSTVEERPTQYVYETEAACVAGIDKQMPQLQNLMRDGSVVECRKQ